MSDSISPLVILDDDGSVLCVDPLVSDLHALVSATKEVNSAEFVPRLKEEFETFVSDLEVMMDEIYAGEWDRRVEALKILTPEYRVALERWNNRSEREKYATSLKAEALTPLLIQEAKYLERSNHRVNTAFENCAWFLNGGKPRNNRTLSEDEQHLIQETRNKLVALGVDSRVRLGKLKDVDRKKLCKQLGVNPDGVDPVFIHRSFDKWFVPGEAKDIVRWARKSDAEMDSILATKAEQIAEWIATSAS
ncbi:MAG: hypothetical protein RBU21_15270 [FCB group bacterium]|jgi:hypothetical protein|nr:hypothetical protein [FCB group bacterium]